MMGKKMPSNFSMDLALVSVESMKKYTNINRILYVDKESAQLFKKFPFTDIIITRFPYINESWWNIGKLYTYSLQTEPFIHVDLDIAIDRFFNIPETDIICEFERMLEYSPESSKYLHNDLPTPNSIICSGILGGNNYGTIFKDHFDYAMRVIDKNEEATFENLFSIEECAFTQEIKKRNLSIGSPNNKTFTHYQGYNKEIRFKNEIIYLKSKILKGAIN